MENISKKEAERLIGLYMAGETGEAEHKKLREFFRSGEVPREWEPYRWMLTMTPRDDSEALWEAEVLPRPESLWRRKRLSWVVAATAVAAAVVLVVLLWPADAGQRSQHKMASAEVSASSTCRGFHCQLSTVNCQLSTAKAQHADPGVTPARRSTQKKLSPCRRGSGPQGKAQHADPGVTPARRSTSDPVSRRSVPEQSDRFCTTTSQRLRAEIVEAASDVPGDYAIN